MENTEQKPSQSNQIQQNTLIQIETGGTVKIKGNPFEISEIAEMLKSQPIFSSQDQFGNHFQGRNPRKICSNPNQQPFSAIGVLFVNFQYSKNGQGYATAFLIADNILLTAAHNVYDRDENNCAKYVNLIMEVHQTQSKVFRALCAYVPKEYKQSKNYSQIQNHDFAILILGGGEELAKRKYTKVQLSLNVKENNKINVCGYPYQFSQEQTKQIKKIQSGETARKPQEKYLFESQGEIKNLEIARISYNATTSKGNSGSPVLRLNQSSGKYQAVGIHTTGNKFKNSGVRITKKLVNRINDWSKKFWEGKQSDERIMLIGKGHYQIFPVNPVPVQPIHKLFNKGKIPITPDTTTLAWKLNQYKQDNANKNVCIYQGISYDWLCSSDLPSDGEWVFTIKAIKVNKMKKWLFWGRQGSIISIGVMDSRKKGDEQKDTKNDCVYLNIFYQKIWKPNQEQTKCQEIDCSCQQLLAFLPCFIECHVNRQQSTIAWHYNGKEQAKTNMPQSWIDGRKICAVVHIGQQDCVEFM